MKNCLSKMLLAIFLLTSSRLLAYPENQLAKDFPTIILPHFLLGENRSFVARDQHLIHYFRLPALTPANSGTLVLLPGQGEPAISYAELAYDLNRSGYTVYILDHRGQGQSDRLINDRNVGYVDSFDDYVADVDQLIGKEIPASEGQELILMGHSMGGCIATLFLSKMPAAQRIKKVVLSSPMLSLITKPYPKLLAEAIVTAAVDLGEAEQYALGKSTFNIPAPLDPSENGKSVLRNQDILGLYQNYPQYFLHGPSNKWVMEAFIATNRITLGMNDLASKIHVPMLMLSAGQDGVVHVKAETKFCLEVKNHQKTTCTQKLYPTSYHSIFEEQDSVRSDALQQVLNFIRL